MKTTKILALLSPLLIGASAFAGTETLTFAGECSLSLKGEAHKRIGSFQLEAKQGDCPSKNMEFTVPTAGGAVPYGVYVEFQRSEFGPGLTDKPFFGYFEGGDGSLKNSTRAFNAKPGTVLSFSQELREGARLHCSGRVK